MADTANLILPLMSAAQSQKHVTHNEAVLRLDVLVQLAVKSTVLATPPVSPSDGDQYLIASGATGAWAGKDLNITYYSSGAWVFLPPRKGWLCWDETNSRLITWSGTAWYAPTISLDYSTGAYLNNLAVGAGHTAATGATFHVKSAGGAQGWFESTSTGGAGMIGYLTATPTSVDERLGFLIFGSREGGTTSANSVAITGHASEVWNPGVARGSDLRIFTTANGTASRVEVVRITDNGCLNIGTTGDRNNKLSVSGNNVLFNHAGAGISATFNKNAAANDAGFTFQTGFSSRALFGLLGSDELQFKVTPDGSSFFTNIRGYKDLHGRTAFKDAYRKTFAEWQGRPNSTTLDQFGLTATVTGTATAVGVTSSALFTAAPRIDLATAATAGASAGLNGPLCVWRGNASGLGGFYLRMRGGIETFRATSRGFMGLYASASAIGNVNPSTLLNMVGVGFDSGDTQLQLMTNDGTGTATKTALGAGFPTTGGWDLYELILSAEPNASVINYRVERLNGGNVATGTISTDLPANTSFLAPHVWFNNGTTAGSSVFGFVDMYLEYSNLLGSQGVM